MERSDLEVFEKYCLGMDEKQAEVPAFVKEKYKGLFVNKKMKVILSQNFGRNMVSQAIEMDW